MSYSCGDAGRWSVSDTVCWQTDSKKKKKSICSIWQFLWCKYSQHSWFQTNLGKDEHRQHSSASTCSSSTPLSWRKQKLIAQKVKVLKSKLMRKYIFMNFEWLTLNQLTLRLKMVNILPLHGGKWENDMRPIMCSIWSRIFPYRK